MRAALLRAACAPGARRSAVPWRRSGAVCSTSPPAPAAAAVERTAVDGLVSCAPSWAALGSAHVTALASTLGRADTAAVALRARCDAASQLHADTAMDVLDDSQDLLDVCSGAFEGQMALCVALVDAHLRYLADYLLTSSTANLTAGYTQLASLPPLTRRQQTAGASAVGATALLALREDAELWRTMLALAEEGDDSDAASKAASAQALCAAVDAVIAAMPQPEVD
jgi:hypothetical protein